MNISEAIQVLKKRGICVSVTPDDMYRIWDHGGQDG
jgi:biotin operon repressor